MSGLDDRRGLVLGRFGELTMRRISHECLHSAR
jgi:hypothetical protein